MRWKPTHAGLRLAASGLTLVLFWSLSTSWSSAAQVDEPVDLAYAAQDDPQPPDQPPPPPGRGLRRPGPPEGRGQGFRPDGPPPGAPFGGRRGPGPGPGGPPPGPGGPGRLERMPSRPPGPPPAPPMFSILDQDADGILSADEIKNAPKALLARDANKDGKLTHDELVPGRPGRAAGANRPRFGRGGPPPPPDDADAAPTPPETRRGGPPRSDDLPPPSGDRPRGRGRGGPGRGGPPPAASTDTDAS